MGNPSAQTLNDAKHLNSITNTWTPWGDYTTNTSLESDHAKTNSLGAHPSTVTYGFTIRSLVATANVLAET